MKIWTSLIIWPACFPGWILIDLENFEAVLDSGEHTSSGADLINLTQKPGLYEFYPGVSDDETLGRIYVEDMEMLTFPDQVKPYFDYEAYGRDAWIHENGHFAPGGYVVKQRRQIFRGSVSRDRRIFPRSIRFLRSRSSLSGSRWRPIKKSLTVLSLEGYRKIAKKDHEDR